MDNENKIKALRVDSKEMEVSTKMMRQLLDTSDTSIYVSDYETDELLYINEEGKKVLGVTGTLTSGNKCYSFLMRRDSPCQFCHKSMLSYDEFRDKVITFPFNGHQYRIRSKIIIWGGRKAHVHYITDETKLLNEQKELRKLTDSIPAGIGIYYLYPDGRFESSYLNDGYYEMIGTTRDKRERYSGFTVLDAIYPEDAVSLQQEIKTAVRENRQINHEIRVLRDDGSYIWLGIRADIVSRTDTRYTLYCAYSDIDQLKRTQYELEQSSKMINDAYQKVKASERSFHTMMEHIPGAMVIFEVRNNMLSLKYISESCKSISGFTAEETYKRNGKDYLSDAHLDSREFFEKHERQDIESGRKISYKYQIICKDGTYKWVSLSLSPVVTDGKLLYYGVLRDIDTDETEHIERENRFEQYIAHMDSVVDDDLIAKGRYDITDNKILYYRRKADTSLVLSDDISYDYALEQMVRTAAVKEQGDELRNKMNRRTLLKDYVCDRKNATIEYQRCAENGASFWSLLRYSLHKDPNSGNVNYFVYTYDITERVLEKRMIAKLGATEYDVLGLIDVKTHQFESKSIKGVKSLAGSGNRYIKGLFEEVVHRQILATVHEMERDDLESQLKLDVIIDKLNEMDTYFVAFSAYKSDQEYRRKKMSFSYLDESKTTIFYYCNDVTELYNREQEQLRKTESALESARIASESKTEFFSRMSHDMRTPMNGILGMADLSEDEDDIDILRDNMQKIKSSGEYLLGLINDTLDFQRIESGKLQLEKEVVNCKDVMLNVMDMVKTTIEKKHINFRTGNQNINMDCYVRVDSVRLKQIFINLISNAIKFTPEGGTINAEFECVKREGMISHDKFVISDTGIGMSEDFIRNKIFNPFSQEHNEVTGQYAGSGLGLSIVKRLVELMGGTIEVESELGVGTKFTLCIDFERVNKDEVVDAEVNENKHQDDVRQCLQGRKILLAEDHPLNAEIAGKLLNKVGCDVTWVKDGQECVEMFKKSSKNYYDVILMDVRMPVLDGIGATRKIRLMKRQDAKSIPIIAMTANAYEDDVRNCLNAGMNNHIAKPIEPAVMYDAITKVIKEVGA